MIGKQAAIRTRRSSVRRRKGMSEDLSCSLEDDWGEEITRRPRSLDSWAESGRRARGLWSSCGSMANGGRGKVMDSDLIAARKGS